MTWLAAVASAAPATPICRTNMRMGSNAIFRMAPDMSPIMPREAFPS